MFRLERDLRFDMLQRDQLALVGISSGLSAISDSICSEMVPGAIAMTFRLERDLRFDMLGMADRAQLRPVPA